MTPDRSQAAILAERVDVALALGEANAALNRAIAVAGGAEIARMACEDGCAAADTAGAEIGERTARDGLAAARARVKELEIRLAALDAELAAGH